MRKTIMAVSCGGAVLAVLGLNQSAEAHIRLTAPTSRHPIPEEEDNSFLKDGPCGGVGDSRTTDPARISTFAPGETITLEWHETIHHESHYRIAFDADGQDDFVNPSSESDIVNPPALPILLDGIADTSGSEDSFSIQVTLPETPCDNCTLQLMQYMYDRADPFYYQCADIVITGDPGDPPGGGGTSGTGGTAGTGGNSGAPAGGASGVGGSLSSGGTSQVPGETGGASGEDIPDGPESEADEAAGCTLVKSSAPLGSPDDWENRVAAIFLTLSAAVVLRRGRRTGS